MTQDGQTSDPGETNLPEPIIEFPSWPELLSHLLANPDPGAIYRGQAGWDWPLMSKLERVLPQGDGGPAPLDVEQQIHRVFIDRARATLPSVPDEHDELGWLSLMQHYGAPTRLLDWTKSPLIAIFFAYADTARSDSETRALWMLQAARCRYWLFGVPMDTRRDPFGLTRHQTWSQGKIVEDRFPGVEIDWPSEENARARELRRDPERAKVPMPTVPASPDARMIAQQAVFTYDAQLRDGIPFPLVESVPIPVFTDISDGKQGVTVQHATIHLLQKIALPGGWRREVLRDLRVMGITADGLFPGLDGIGRAAELTALLPIEFEGLLGM